MENKIWDKTYECECHAEMITLCKVEDGYIDFAIFRNSLNEAYVNSFRGKCKLIWDILSGKGVWTDNIILNKHTARRLGRDLINLTDKE